MIAAPALLEIQERLEDPDAASDPSGTLASPVETIPRGRGDTQRIALLVLEREAREVGVGYPASLSGDEGPAARSAREFARTLASAGRLTAGPSL